MAEPTPTEPGEALELPHTEALLEKWEDWASLHRGGKQSVNRLAGQLREALRADRRALAHREEPRGE